MYGNDKQLPLFAINYPFIAGIFHCKEKNSVLLMLAQKYLHRNNFYNLVSRQLELHCLYEHIHLN